MRFYSILFFIFLLPLQPAGARSDDFSVNGWFPLPPCDEVIGGVGVSDRLPMVGSAPFRALVWNIYKGQREKALDDLGALAEKSDVVLLQEALLNQPFHSFFSRHETWAWNWAVSFIKEPRVGTGVATGSRFRPASVDFLRSKGREAIVGTPKVALITYFPLENSERSLLVINIHAVNFVTLASYREQIEQVRGVIAEHSGPVLLAGDFNTWNWQRRKILENLVDDFALHWVKLSKDGRWLPLDHALVRGLNVHGAELLKGVDSSDHQPVYLELSWNQTAWP